MAIGKELYPEMKIELVPRKVKTESLLSWEHEKFRIKKMNSLTLSSFSVSSWSIYILHFISDVHFIPY